MRKAVAALGSGVFLVLAPGVVAGPVPWWLTGWQARALPAWWLALRLAGVVLLAAGVVVLVQAFARFVVEGLGTPAPVAPTQELIVGGSTGTCATRCTWPSSPPSSGRPWSSVSSSCCRMPRWWRPPSSPSSTGTRSRPWPGSSASATQAYRQAVPGWWPRRRPWRPAGDGR